MARFSTITCNYNHGMYLRQAIESVLSQSHLPDEYIILDDCSTDDSVDIIDDYASRNSIIRFIRNEHNIGALPSVKKILKLAQGDYISILSADDFLLPGFFEKAAELADQYPSAGIILGKMEIIDEKSNLLDIVGVSGWHESGYVTSEQFLSEYLEQELPNHSLCGPSIWKKSALDETEFPDSRLGSWCDTFAARAIALKYGACYIAEPVHCWRYLPNSLSNAKAANTNNALQIIDNAVKLMRSPKFRDRFPEDHVLRWSQRYKDMLATQVMGKK